VDPSPDFPTGCRIHYRAYYADEVSEIYPGGRIPGLQCGEVVGNLERRTFLDTPFVPVKIRVSSFPEASEERPNSGMHVLQSMPDGRKLRIQQFEPGARAEIEKTLEAVKLSTSECDDAKSKSQWDEWAATIPVDDNAANHMQLLHVPFHQVLFGPATPVTALPPITVRGNGGVSYTDLLDARGVNGLTGEARPSVGWAGAPIPAYDADAESRRPRRLDPHPALTATTILPPLARQHRAEAAVRKRKMKAGWAQFKKDELLQLGMGKFDRKVLDTEAKKIDPKKAFKSLIVGDIIKVLEALGMQAPPAAAAGAEGAGGGTGRGEEDAEDEKASEDGDQARRGQQGARMRAEEEEGEEEEEEREGEEQDDEEPIRKRSKGATNDGDKGDEHVDA
jgi:hypothetical protein